LKGYYAVVLAAGSGRRMGLDQNKVFLNLCGVPVLKRSLAAFVECGYFDKIYLVCKPEELKTAEELAKSIPGICCELVEGGAERQDSVMNALRKIPGDAELIAVHDAARCLVSPELIGRCVKSTETYGSGVAGKRVHDTVKRVKGEQIVETLDRKELVMIETPQVFKAGILQKAYRAAYDEGYLGTDDAGLVEKMGIHPRLVVSEQPNFKITHPQDLKMGGLLLNEEGS